MVMTSALHAEDRGFDPRLEYNFFVIQIFCSVQKMAVMLVDAATRGEESIVCSLLEVIDVNSQNELGLTALHSASWNGKESIVSLLLERGADVNIKNKVGISSFLSLFHSYFI